MVLGFLWEPFDQLWGHHLGYLKDHLGAGHFHMEISMAQWLDALEWKILFPYGCFGGTTMTSETSIWSYYYPFFGMPTTLPFQGSSWWCCMIPWGGSLKGNLWKPGQMRPKSNSLQMVDPTQETCIQMFSNQIDPDGPFHSWQTATGHIHPYSCFSFTFLSKRTIDRISSKLSMNRILWQPATGWVLSKPNLPFFF